MYSPIEPESVEPRLAPPESAESSETKRLELPKATVPPEHSASFYIVGIGASAGGLQPIETFFAQMPSDTGACFVVIQHLSPDFKSLMKELLERRTSLPIYKVENGMVPCKDSIYLIPPGQNLIIRDRQFHLLSQERDTAMPVPHYPINLFFQSLAEDCGDRAIGVVLSGTGSDGTRGLQAINEAGGLTLVQDPSTAEFTGMPNSAIETRMIDQILSPPELAQTIARLVSSPQVIADLRTESNRIRLAAPDLAQIIQILSDQEQVDFSFYKESTLSRRIHRRCLAAGFQSLRDYIQHLGASEEERMLLKGDLLIKVSSFFRNPEAWSFLEKQVLPGLLEVMEPQRPLRIWSAACATGEEAYSLAMLIHELADQLGCPVHAKIFATDLDQAALDRASLGVYPDTIRSEVSARFLHKYFEPRDNGFEIKRQIRKMVIFANHNLVQDAGFTRLDLISCRNVLIYMQGQLQQKVLHGLNFSLRSNGILFLGESETLGNSESAFTTLHGRWRIYRKFRATNLLNIPRASLQEHWLSSRSSPRATTPSSLDPILEGTLRGVVSRRGATCLVVDRHNCLIHVAGGSTDVLLVPEGRLSNDLAQRVVPSLRLPINTAMNRARRSGTEGASYRGIVLREQEPEVRTVKLEVWPLASKEPGVPSSSGCEDLLIILIETDSTESSKPETTIPLFEAGQEASHRISEIEYELQQTRENLQATIEELETTNEEQQATNEELIASNEELQSTNEELHSVNEELYTVNSEYESKIQELLQLNSDIDNLLKSTEIGVIFLDKDLAIRKFTPAARAVIKLVNTDVGRSVVDLSHSMVLEDFPALLKSVLASGQPDSYEVELQDGRHMLMRLHPYPTHNDEMDGVVISFVEISRLKQTEQDLRHAQRQLTLNNEALERRVADRTRVLERFSHHLRQLHYISTNTYASEAELLQAYLQAGCSIFGLTTGSLICFHSNRLTLKAFCSTVFEQEIGQTFSHEIHCSEALHCPWLPWSQRQKTVGYDTVDSLELNEHPLYAAAGIQSYLATKIQLETEGFGLLEFGAIAPRPQAFEQHELEILELIAAGMANAMAREQAQRALVAQEAEYRKFYNETPVMLHSVDAMGHLLSVSDYWLEKLGYTRAEVLGRSILDFLTSASQTYARRVVVPEFLKLGSSLDVPYQMVRQDGQVIDVLLSAIAERDPAGQLRRTLAVLVDVTESRRLQSELQQAQALAKAKETAEVANRAKSRFLASITHELRTPLNSVLGFSELLERDRSLGLEQIKQVETIRRAGKHLLSLINNVLDLSTLEAEQIAPVYSHFDLHWLLEQEIWNLFEQQAATKGLRFEILQDPAVPQYIYTDPVRLRQILINLVGNAIKFTQSGQVSLRVSAIAATCSLDADTPASGELLRFSIMDTGPGIADPQLPYLFDTFAPSDRVPEGAGLGLSLSYQLARLLGGELTVESQIGEGSTFTLTLPVQRSDATEGQRAIDFRAVIGLTPGQLSYRILVVDSDVDNQQFLVSLLTQVGFQVQAVRHGTEVLPLWQRWQPSLVLIDIQLPQIDGPALVRQLKNTPQGQHTPVIILTASVFEQNQAEIMATGCDHYLKKPVDAAEILSTIQRHLQVTYLYADSNPAAPSGERADESQILSVSRLSQLQTLWLDDFYQALAIGATAQMYQLIDQLPPEQSEVAIALERQISQYRFQTLLELFAPLCEH